MSPRLARAIYGAASRSGAVAGLRWLRRHRVPVLCYHSVVDVPLPLGVARGGLHVPAREFRAQLRYVAHRYQIVPLRQAIAALAGEATPLPARAVALTFDDGYANNVHVAAPILRDFGFRGTCFLATDYIESGELYWWDEVVLALTAGAGRVAAAGDGWGRLDLASAPGRAAAADTAARLLGAATLVERRRLLDNLWTLLMGQRERHPDLREHLRPARWSELRSAADVFDFGGHSAEHRFLDHLPPAELREDLARCRRALETRLAPNGRLPFAYPAGRRTLGVAEAVQLAGFGTAMDARLRPREQRLASHGLDRWAVPRVGVSGGMSLDAFAAALVGLPSLLAERLSPGGRW